MKIGLIGLGLMGTSLGLALSKYRPDLHLSGYDINNEHLDYVLKKGIIKEILDLKNLKDIDILFIATPVRSVISVLERINDRINSKKTLVTDLGSTKNFLKKEIEKRFPHINYIGGHPMTGREKSGPEAAVAELYENKNYIIVKSDNLDKGMWYKYKQLISLINDIGARVIEMNVEEHDRGVALTSHLPQLIASTLNTYCNRTIVKGNMEKLIGQGFLDLTRIAGSDPEMWVDIFVTNKENIVTKINEYINELIYLKSLLIKDQEDEVYNYLLDSKYTRLEIEKVKGI